MVYSPTCREALRDQRLDFHSKTKTNIKFQAYYLPSQIHQLGFAIITLFINLLTCIVLMTIRREFQTQSRSRPEQGNTET